MTYYIIESESITKNIDGQDFKFHIEFSSENSAYYMYESDGGSLIMKEPKRDMTGSFMKGMEEIVDTLIKTVGEERVKEVLNKQINLKKLKDCDIPLHVICEYNTNRGNLAIRINKYTSYGKVCYTQEGKHYVSLGGCKTDEDVMIAVRHTMNHYKSWKWVKGLKVD